MMHRLARLIAVFPLAATISAVPVLVVFGLVAVPNTVAGNPCFHGLAMPPPSDAAVARIELAACAFSPTVARIEPGSTVAFVNGSGFTHLITGANQSWGSRDVEVDPGETVSYSFDAPGIYAYACALHPGMSGAIVVGDAGTVAGPGTVSDGSAGSSAKTGAASVAADPQPGLAVVAGGTLAGAFVGAAGLWIVIRRWRSPMRPRIADD